MQLRFQVDSSLLLNTLAIFHWYFVITLLFIQASIIHFPKDFLASVYKRSTDLKKSQIHMLTTYFNNNEMCNKQQNEQQKPLTIYNL